MNKIYGFGNALIDIEIRISEDQLKNISIPKGSMKHISEMELTRFLDIFGYPGMRRRHVGVIFRRFFACKKMFEN